MNWRNILSRAGWAALWAAISAAPITEISLAVTNGDLPGLKRLGLSALAAGIAAALSFIKTIAAEKMEQKG